MNDEMFFFGLGHFMQESGGSRTGTASMSMFQNWLMGRMPQRIAEDMAQAGLLNKSALHYGKTGHITRVDAEGIKDASTFIQNPFEWVNTVLTPVLKARGYSGDKLNVKVASLLGIRTASNQADQFIREEQVARRYIERAKQAAGVDQLYNLGKDTYQGNVLEMEAKWRDALRELGQTTLPIATKAVESMNAALKQFAQFAHDHETAVKGLTIAFGGLSAALAIGGTIALARMGLKSFSVAAEFLGAPAGVLAAATTGIKGFGKALGWLGGIAAAWEVGKFAGGLINDHVLSDGAKDKMGEWIARGLALFGNQEAKEALDINQRLKSGQPRPVPMPSAATRGSTGGDVYLDREKVGKILDARQAKQLGRQPTGPRAVDPTLSLFPVTAGLGG